MSKRYQLLKDLPDLKAGVIFERRGDITMPTHRDYSFSIEGGKRWWYSPALVENNPDWFKPIEDKEPTALNLDDKCLSLNDVMDCIYTWEEIKKQHLAHSHTFYRNDLKNNHPLIIRLKEKLKTKIKEPTAFQWDREPFDKFEVAVEREVNKLSLDNQSNTPDFILAEFIRKMLELFSKAVAARDKHKTPPPLSQSIPAGKGTANETINEEKVDLSFQKKYNEDDLKKAFDNAHLMKGDRYVYNTFEDYKNKNL